jgi:hypothetical protein
MIITLIFQVRKGSALEVTTINLPSFIKINQAQQGHVGHFRVPKF